MTHSRVFRPIRLVLYAILSLQIVPPLWLLITQVLENLRQSASNLRFLPEPSTDFALDIGGFGTSFATGIIVLSLLLFLNGFVFFGLFILELRKGAKGKAAT